jgi:hypothetical protein
MTFVTLVQTRIEQTKTDESDRAAGYRDGLTEALALMLQAQVSDVKQAP